MTAFREWREADQPWDEAPELWELQAGPHLTVGELRSVLAEVDPDLPVTVTFYDGSSGRTLRPTEIGFAGGLTARPDGVAITTINAAE